MSLRLRPATPRDYDAYAAFHLLLGVPEPPAPADYWAQVLAPRSELVDRDGKTAAWLMTDRFGPWFFVTTLVVGPEFQRQGLAREIMTRAAQAARVGGATGWALNVKEDNAPARRLYESLGMREHSREYVVKVPASFPFERGEALIHAANAADLEALEKRFNFLPTQLQGRGADTMLVSEKLSGIADVRGPHGPIRSRAESDELAEALLSVGSGRLSAKEFGVVINSSTLKDSLLARGASPLFTSIQLRARL